MESTVSRRSIVVAAEGQVSCDLVEEAVIFQKWIYRLRATTQTHTG